MSHTNTMIINEMSIIHMFIPELFQYYTDTVVPPIPPISILGTDEKEAWYSEIGGIWGDDDDCSTK